MPCDQVIDTDELSSEWAALGAKLLNSAELAQQADKRSPLFVPDAEVWQVGLLDSNDPRSYELDLAAIDGEFVDLLDEIRGLVVRRLMGSSGR